MKEKNYKTKSFEQLVSEKAGCLEFSLNGYIRLYEEDKPCQCHDCITFKKLKNDWDISWDDGFENPY